MVKIVGVILFVLGILAFVLSLIMIVAEGEMGFILLLSLGILICYYIFTTGTFDRKKTVQDELDIETKILEKRIEIKNIIKELDKLEG